MLEVRWHIYAKEENWAACVGIAEAVILIDPNRLDAWIHRSFALHELKRTQEAFDQLLPVADMQDACMQVLTIDTEHWRC